MARRINMGSSVDRQVELRVVGERSILHAELEPQEVADPILGTIERKVRCVPVGDVKDSPIAVHFSPYGFRGVAALPGTVDGGGSEEEARECEQKGLVVHGWVR